MVKRKDDALDVVTGVPRPAFHAKIPTLVEESRYLRRLLALLDNDAKITVLDALPGFGKTALLAAWAHRKKAQGHMVEWVTMGDSQELGTQRAVERLVRSGEQSILVLDDFFVADDSPLLSEVYQWLMSGHSRQLVVSTVRSRRIRAEATRWNMEIDTIDGWTLLASAEELPELAELWGYELSSCKAAELHRLTGGWLILARSVLNGGWSGLEVSVQTRMFLANTFLTRFSDGPGRWLASRLALAPQIVPEHLEVAAEASAQEYPVARPLDALEMLRDYERFGVICRSVTPQGVVSWRFADLVRGVLAEDFTSSKPSQARQWHSMMAEEFLSTGEQMNVPLALLHAREGHRWDVLAEIWRQKGMVSALKYPTDFQIAYGGLPRSAGVAKPMLLMVAGVIAAAEGFADGQQRYLRGHRDLMGAFRAMDRYGQVAAGGGGDPENRQSFVVAAMISRRTMGKFDEADQIAMDYLETVEHTGIQPKAWFLQQRALTTLLCGNVAHAKRQFPIAYDMARTPDEDFIGVDSANNMALVCALSGLVETAEAWLHTAEEVTLTNDWLAYQVGIPGYVARALVHAESLDLAAAAAELSKAGDGTNQVELWPFILYASTELSLLNHNSLAMAGLLRTVADVNANTVTEGSAAAVIVARCHAELMLSKGELNRAARLLADTPDAHGWLTVPTVRLHLMAGDFTRAARIAGAGYWGKHKVQRDRLELRLLQAVALFHVGKTDAAAAAYADVIAVARINNQLRPFTTICAKMRELLTAQCGVGLTEEQEEKVASIPAIYPVSGTLVVLSPRELTVLYLMEKHSTVAKIARELVVSPNTIKKQVGSIYSKFGVSDRQSALEQAHFLAFLPAPDPAAS